jgi:hypothetical protein
MLTVFSEALDAAKSNGPWAVLRLFSRELNDLPGALLREHIQSRGEKETRMEPSNHLTTNQADTGSLASENKPTSGWREITLAALPFLLILLEESIPRLLVAVGLLTWESDAMGILNPAMGILGAAILLVTFFVGWRRKWPDWSASWYMFFVIIPVVFLQWLVTSLINDERSSYIFSQELLFYFIVPVSVAVLLYAVTRLDRRRGLLAAFPLLYFLWSPNLEFVADPIEVAIKIASTILISLAVIALMRQADWRVGLYAVLLANLGVGFLYSYAGIFYGGMLPFSAPGPSL